MLNPISLQSIAFVNLRNGLSSPTITLIRPKSMANACYTKASMPRGLRLNLDVKMKRTAASSSRSFRNESKISLKVRRIFSRLFQLPCSDGKPFGLLYGPTWLAYWPQLWRRRRRLLLGRRRGHQNSGKSKGILNDEKALAPKWIFCLETWFSSTRVWNGGPLRLWSLGERARLGDDGTLCLSNQHLWYWQLLWENRRILAVSSLILE